MEKALVKANKKNHVKSHERGQNWTQAEKILFLELVRISPSIIENKLDTESIKQKNAEWSQVQNKFSEFTGKSRSIYQLKKFWSNAKWMTLRNYKEALKSNGLPPPSPSQEDLIVMEICSTEVAELNKNISNETGTSFSNDDNSVADVHNTEEICPSEFVELNGTISNETGSSLSNDDNTVADVHNTEEICPSDFVELNETIPNETGTSFLNGGGITADVHNTEVHIETKDPLSIWDKKAETQSKLKHKTDNIKVYSGDAKTQRFKNRTSHKGTILFCASNNDYKKRSLAMLEEEHQLKMRYLEQDLIHQERRHNIEIETLLLEKAKKELEIRALNKL